MGRFNEVLRKAREEIEKYTPEELEQIIKYAEEERKNEMWENRELGADERYVKVSKRRNREVHTRGTRTNN